MTTPTNQHLPTCVLCGGPVDNGSTERICNFHGSDEVREYRLYGRKQTADPLAGHNALVAKISPIVSRALTTLANQKGQREGKSQPVPMESLSDVFDELSLPSPEGKQVRSTTRLFLGVLGSGDTRAVEIVLTMNVDPGPVHPALIPLLEGKTP